MSDLRDRLARPRSRGKISNSCHQDFFKNSLKAELAVFASLKKFYQNNDLYAFGKLVALQYNLLSHFFMD